MNYSYTTGKMKIAICELASSPEPLYVRVHRMLVEFIVVVDDDVPAEAEPYYEAIMDFIDCIKPVDESPTMPVASDEKYKEIADQACLLTFILSEHRREYQN